MPVRYLLRGAVARTMGLLLMLRGAAGLDNGLAITPPMGWRSWNCFHGDVSAVKIESIIDALSDKARTVDGIPTSLADLGYTHVGVDDGCVLMNSVTHFVPHTCSHGEARGASWCELVLPRR